MADTLRAARERIGISREEAARRVYDLLGNTYAVSSQTVLRYEAPDQAPKRLNPVILLALCEAYDTTIDDLDVPPVVRDDVAKVRRLFTPPMSPSRCNAPRPVALVAA